MEAVQNAVKHSGARAVAVRLSDNGRRLTVSDDGTGFDQVRVRAVGAGAGIVSMGDRLDAVGGTVTIESTPGLGTTVSAQVPSTEAPDPVGTGGPSLRKVG